MPRSKFSIFSPQATQENSERELRFSDWDSAEQLANELHMNPDEAINMQENENGDFEFVVRLTKEQYAPLQFKKLNRN